MNLSDVGTMAVTPWSPRPSPFFPSSHLWVRSLGRYSTLQAFLYLLLIRCLFSNNHACVYVQFTVMWCKNLSTCPRGPCPYIWCLETQTPSTLQIILRMTNFFLLWATVEKLQMWNVKSFYKNMCPHSHAFLSIPVSWVEVPVTFL